MLNSEEMNQKIPVYPAVFRYQLPEFLPMRWYYNGATHGVQGGPMQSIFWASRESDLYGMPSLDALRDLRERTRKQYHDGGRHLDVVYYCPLGLNVKDPNAVPEDVPEAGVYKATDGWLLVGDYPGAEMPTISLEFEHSFKNFIGKRYGAPGIDNDLDFLRSAAPTWWPLILRTYAHAWNISKFAGTVMESVEKLGHNAIIQRIIDRVKEGLRPDSVNARQIGTLPEWTVSIMFQNWIPMQETTGELPRHTIDFDAGRLPKGVTARGMARYPDDVFRVFGTVDEMEQMIKEVAKYGNAIDWKRSDYGSQGISFLTKLNKWIRPPGA